MKKKITGVLQSKGFRWGMNALLVTLLLLVGLNLIVLSVCKWSLIEDINRIPDDRVAMVFATPKMEDDGMVSDFFQNRVTATCDLYREEKVKEVLICGDGLAKVQEMTDALVQGGIPESAIIIDYEAKSTLGAVVRAKEAYGKEKLVMVSQPYQLRRAIFIAKAHNMDAIGYPAPNPPSNFEYAMVHFGEIFVRVGTLLDCYVLGSRPSNTAPSRPLASL